MISLPESNRYSRHLLLPQIGEQGQLRFKNAKVLVIGAGGLGCPVLQYLAAAGIGTIGIVDFDVVDESNLQRQILYNTADIGQSKAHCAKQKLSALNPFITINSIAEELTVHNALLLLDGYDLVVDGSDNFRTRYLVNDACVILGKPLVFGSIYQFEGQVSVFNYRGGPTYRCLYPEPNDIGSCAETGVLGILPGTIGCLMATEALKIVAGTGSVLSGKLLVYDALNASFNSFSFQAVEQNKALKTILPFDEACDTIPEINADALRLKMNSGDPFQLIDVRDQAEFDTRNLSGILIPLKSLPNNLARIKTDIPVIIYCQRGGRSRKAVQFLLKNGYSNVVSLSHGIEGFMH